jgi:PadR family transcriptional regulator, regulatory protein PadR
MSYIVVQMTIPSLGTFELSMLLTVARLGDDAYGLAIRRDLSERTEREHSAGAVYTTLQRLEDKGLLSSRASAPLPVRGGRSRRYYALTGTGALALRHAERAAASLWAGVGVSLPEGLA